MIDAVDGQQSHMLPVTDLNHPGTRVLKIYGQTPYYTIEMIPLSEATTVHYTYFSNEINTNHE